MTRFKYYVLILLATFSLSSCDVLTQAAKQANLPSSIKTPLTNDEVIRGLKAALNLGTDSSVTSLGRTNGYFADALVKIMLPSEANAIISNISKVPGGQKLINDVIMAVNRAAEDAAPQAKQIFINAITGITIQDGFQILRGGENAATNFLKDKTYSQLLSAFSPKVQASLSKPLVLGVSAETAYRKLIDTYNVASLGGTLFAPVKQNSLAAFTTQKALDGLFLKVAKEEKAIRQDPLHRVSDILRRVFSS